MANAWRIAGSLKEDEVTVTVSGGDLLIGGLQATAGAVVLLERG